MSEYFYEDHDPITTNRVAKQARDEALARLYIESAKRRRRDFDAITQQAAIPPRFPTGDKSRIKKEK